MLGFPRTGPAPSCGPRRQPGVTLECSCHTSSSLCDENPVLPVWQLGLGEEMSKESEGLSCWGQRTSVSFWELQLDPTEASPSHCPSPVSAPHLSAEASREPRSELSEAWSHTTNPVRVQSGAHLSPGPGEAEVLNCPHALEDAAGVGTWVRPGPWLPELCRTGMGGSANLDGNASCRVLAFDKTSLVTRRLCGLLTRNTNKNEVQRIPIWVLQPERTQEEAPTCWTIQSVVIYP